MYGWGVGVCMVGLVGGMVILTKGGHILIQNQNIPGDRDGRPYTCSLRHEMCMGIGTSRAHTVRPYKG